MSSHTNRINAIDVAKGIGILCIVLGHIVPNSYVARWLYAFHVPLFFLLSGFTYSLKEDKKAFYLNKAKRLLLPYLIFAVISIAIYIYIYIYGDYSEWFVIRGNENLAPFTGYAICKFQYGLYDMESPALVFAVLVCYSCYFGCVRELAKKASGEFPSSYKSRIYFGCLGHRHHNQYLCQ